MNANGRFNGFDRNSGNISGYYCFTCLQLLLFIFPIMFVVVFKLFYKDEYSELILRS